MHKAVPVAVNWVLVLAYFDPEWSFIFAFVFSLPFPFTQILTSLEFWYTWCMLSFLLNCRRDSWIGRLILSLSSWCSLPPKRRWSYSLDSFWDLPRAGNIAYLDIHWLVTSSYGGRISRAWRVSALAATNLMISVCLCSSVNWQWYAIITPHSSHGFCRVQGLFVPFGNCVCMKIEQQFSKRCPGYPWTDFRASCFLVSPSFTYSG